MTKREVWVGCALQLRFLQGYAQDERVGDVGSERSNSEVEERSGEA